MCGAEPEEQEKEREKEREDGMDLLKSGEPAPGGWGLNGLGKVNVFKHACLDVEPQM